MLKNDKKFFDKIHEFRFGELPKKDWGNDYPLCYVTLASKPEVYRDMFGPTTNINKLPTQKREFEFWIIIVVSTRDTAEETQRSLYELTDMALSILEKNIQLKDDKGKNPLCATNKIITQGRMEKNRGGLVEAMTIRVRPVTFISSGF